MEGMLKVTPEKLLETASEFQGAGSKIKSLTQEMIGLVQGLKGVWQGEAAQIYIGRFHALQSDMDKMYSMMKEHVSDLQEMARQYQTAEAAGIEEGSALAANILS